MDKKAFEVQFNWIFVLVAGAAILLIFTAVVFKQKSVSEASTSTTALKNIEAIIASAGVSTGTTTIIDLPDYEVKIGCGRISIGRSSKQYLSSIFFSPSEIRGTKLVTQTQMFSKPYRATNLLYLTSPQVLYVLVGNTNLAKEINSSMPAALNKENYTSYQLAMSMKNSGNYKVRFVVFENINLQDMNVPNSLIKMNDEDVTLIRVSGADSERGNIYFHSKKNSKWSAPIASKYLSKSSLLAAIYSDNSEIYECNMKNVVLRLNAVTKIYLKRTSELISRTQLITPFTSRQAKCLQIYNEAMSYIISISDSTNTFDLSRFDALSNTANELALRNKEAQKFSCALIY